MMDIVSSIGSFIQNAERILYNHIIKALYKLGEKYDRIIRERGEEESWRDHTRDLRSSVGAAVYSKGELVMETALETILGGSKGSSRGRQLVSSLAHQYTETFVLVLFAAMPYAEKVEGIDGKDVLASASISIERELNKVIQNAIKEAEMEIQILADRL